MTNTRAFSKLMHRVDQPRLTRATWRLRINDLRASAPLCHRFADEQRNNRACKADNQGKDQQHLNVQTLVGDEAIDTQNAQRHAQY